MRGPTLLLRIVPHPAWQRHARKLVVALNSGPSHVLHLEAFVCLGRTWAIWTLDGPNELLPKLRNHSIFAQDMSTVVLVGVVLLVFFCMFCSSLGWIQVRRRYVGANLSEFALFHLLNLSLSRQMLSKALNMQ